MELNKIEELLDRYFDGKTSIDEENVLKKYFSQAFIPVHLEQYKTMFNYFSKAQKETSEVEFTFPKESTKKTRLKLVGIAAILLLTITMITKFNPTKKEIQLTLAEQKEALRAFNETKRAFQLISENLKKGNNAIAYLGEFESTKNKIFINNKTQLK